MGNMPKWVCGTRGSTRLYLDSIQYNMYIYSSLGLPGHVVTWWRHQMETFSALLTLCVGNSLVTGEFAAQRPVTRSFDVFFDLRLNKPLSKQSWRLWFETPSRSSLHWRHNDHDGVSNHQPHGCLLNRLFRRRSKKASKLRVTGLCVENSPGPLNSPHKVQLRGKCFHLMTSSWLWRQSDEVSTHLKIGYSCGCSLFKWGTVTWLKNRAPHNCLDDCCQGLALLTLA